MKMRFFSTLVVLSGLALAIPADSFAGDCKDVAKDLRALSDEIVQYNRLIVKNYENRVRFTKDMYYELSINEGRSLYIPYGTYDSYKRSIGHERSNLDFVQTKTANFEERLHMLNQAMEQCR